MGHVHDRFFTHGAPSGDPESGFAFFTRRPVHVWLHSHQQSLWSVEQNRVRASLRNVRIWGMRAEDIAEAAKCLALGRTTACVFHLMRVMEMAVVRLGKKLKVTVRDKHDKELAWGPILGNIGKAIEALQRTIPRSRNCLKLTRYSTTLRRHGLATQFIQNRPTPKKRRERCLRRPSLLWVAWRSSFRMSDGISGFTRAY
jgi:hypothetical protein